MLQRIQDLIRQVTNFGIGVFTLGNILGAALVFVLCLLLIQLVNALVQRTCARSQRVNPTLAHFLQSAIKVVLWVVAIIIIAGMFGIPTASLVTLVGIAGLALSLSIQNVMSNLFSGITLLVTRPFKEGDCVDVAGKLGIIQHVGLFYTVLNTLDNVRVNIPNGDVTAASVTNYSSEPLRRVDQTFCASYSASTAQVREAILAAAKSDSRILSVPAPFVSINAYKDSCIEYVSRVYCNCADYWDVYFTMNERVREEFEKHGVQMTYPHVNVHLDK